MAYRHLHTSFWQDPFCFEECDFFQKMFYVYIMQNSKTTQCGCYEYSEKIMSLETALPEKKIKELMEFLQEHKKIIVNKEKKELLICNWLKHNSFRSPKVLACIQKELKNIKTDIFKRYITDIIEGKTDIDTLSIDYLYCIDTVSIDYTKTIDNHIGKENTVSIDYTKTIDTCLQEKEKEKEKEFKKKNHASNDAGEIEKTFDLFWNKYGKKIDRVVCLKKWKALKQEERQQILETVDGYVKSTPEVQFRKNPETFLNRKSWLDFKINPETQTIEKVTVDVWKENNPDKRIRYDRENKKYYYTIIPEGWKLTDFGWYENEKGRQRSENEIWQKIYIEEIEVQ